MAKTAEFRNAGCSLLKESDLPILQTGSVYPTCQTITLVWGCGRHAFSVSLLALADWGRVRTRRGKQALCLFSNGLLLGS